MQRACIVMAWADSFQHRRGGWIAATSPDRLHTISAAANSNAAR
jgi:hypothetical protein